MSCLRLVKCVSGKKLERGSVSGYKLIHDDYLLIFKIDVWETVLVIFTIGPACYTISVYNSHVAGGFTRSFLELDKFISYLDEHCLEGDQYIFPNDTDIGGDLAYVFRDELVSVLKECDKVADGYYGE